MEQIVGRFALGALTYRTRAQVTTRKVPSWCNEIEVGGCLTWGDGGAVTMRRVGSVPSHLGYVQDAVGAYWEYMLPRTGIQVEAFDHLRVSTNSSPALAAAHGFIAAKGGGILLLDSKQYFITETFEITTSNVFILGKGCGYIHDTGPFYYSTSATQILVTGTITGAMIHFRSPEGGANVQKQNGGGIIGVALWAEDDADYGIQVQSWRNLIGQSLFVREAAIAGYFFNVVASLGEARDTQGCEFSHIYGRQRTSAAGHVILLDGEGPANGVANTSLNTFRNITAQYKDGVAIYFRDCDNNEFFDVTLYLLDAGAGDAVRFGGSDALPGGGRYNRVFHITAGAERIVAEGTDAGWVYASRENEVHFDIGNGTQIPIIGTDAILRWSDNQGDHAYYSHIRSGFGSNITDARLAEAKAKTGDYSAAIYNGASAGIWFGGADHGYGINVNNSNGDFRLVKADGVGGKFNTLNTVINTDASYEVDGVKVLGNRVTGWTAATGTATRSTFDTGSVTTAQLAERFKAVIDDLIAHGIIGT